MPLMVKLLILAILPVLFAAYLTWQYYAEKTAKVLQIRAHQDNIEQIATISRLIDQLQVERGYSSDLLRYDSAAPNLQEQRHLTDSLLSGLDSSGANLAGFRKYVFLDNLDSVRARIDRKKYSQDMIMHFYSSAIFRFGTFNRPASYFSTTFSGLYNHLVVQKLLGEIITFQGIITANVDNLLHTRAYIPETLFGTLPSYDMYKSYEKELLIKADPFSLQYYQQLKDSAALGKLQHHLAALFSSFQLDPELKIPQWRLLSSQSLNDLRLMQMNHLDSAENIIQNYYKREVRLRNQALLWLSIFSILIVALSVYILISINKSLRRLTRAAVLLSKGKTDIRLPVLPGDAIGTLADSIHAIDTNNKKLTAAAEKIGKGDFSTEIEVRSGYDLLGNAIKKMKDDLGAYTTALQRSKEEFETLANFMPQIVWISDPGGHTTYYNRKWYELTGINFGNGLGDWHNAIHPDDIHPMLSLWNRSMERGDDFESECRIKMKNGDYRWHLARAVPVKDKDGSIIKWFGTSTDIHDHKIQTDKLEEMVAQRTLELNRSNEDLQQFAHIASHDLKEPLRKVTMFSSRLSNEFGELLPEKGKTYLEKVNNASMRMTTLIEDILGYASLNGSSAEFEEVDMNQTIVEVMDHLEVLINQKKALINYNKLPKLPGVPSLMFQLFYNLVNNALKFSKPGISPLIDISADQVNGSVLQNMLNGNLRSQYNRLDFFHITVSDNGIGFDQDYAEKIFTAFTRLTSRDKIEGTGLGLSLCQKIVYRHNGAIYAESTEGVGSSFHILLPTIQNN